MDPILDQVLKVLKNPIFAVLTVVGNAVLLFCAIVFYVIEGAVNPSVGGFSDAIWWAFVTMTTVGYGDIVPITGAGRVISIVLMLTGGVLFLSLVALLSSAFTELEYLEMKKEFRELKLVLADIIRKSHENDKAGP